MAAVRPRVPGVCQRCHFGQHSMCEDETWDDEAYMTVDCRCADNDHIRPTM